MLQTRGGQAERRAETCATGAGGSETGAHLSRRDEQRSQQSGTGTGALEMGYNVNDLDPFRFVPIQSDPNLLARSDPGTGSGSDLEYDMQLALG